ncbi:MAG: Mut7-C RNAse domain-containing protein [candidate division WOR-3 bacterium]
MAVRFLVDFMLGKLARELRILGFDTEYLSYNKIINKTPLEILQTAQKENRILLTRTRKLKDYPAVLFIESDNVGKQVIQVLDYFKLHNEIKPGSRCLLCNNELTPIPKEVVKNRVPYYVYKTQSDFVFCTQCQKIYWPGSHYLDMQNRIKAYLSSK